MSLGCPSRSPGTACLTQALRVHQTIACSLATCHSASSPSRYDNELDVSPVMASLASPLE